MNPALWGVLSSLSPGTADFMARYSSRAIGETSAFLGVLVVGSIIMCGSRCENVHQTPETGTATSDPAASARPGHARRLWLSHPVRRQRRPWSRDCCSCGIDFRRCDRVAGVDSSAGADQPCSVDRHRPDICLCSNVVRLVPTEQGPKLYSTQRMEIARLMAVICFLQSAVVFSLPFCR